MNSTMDAHSTYWWNCCPQRFFEGPRHLTDNVFLNGPCPQCEIQAARTRNDRQQRLEQGEDPDILEEERLILQVRYWRLWESRLRFHELAPGQDLIGPASEGVEVGIANGALLEGERILRRLENQQRLAIYRNMQRIRLLIAEMSQRRQARQNRAAAIQQVPGSHVRGDGILANLPAFGQSVRGVLSLMRLRTQERESEEDGCEMPRTDLQSPLLQTFSQNFSNVAQEDQGQEPSAAEVEAALDDDLVFQQQ